MVKAATAIAPVNDPAALINIELAKGALVQSREQLKTDFFVKAGELGEQAARASTTIVDLAFAFQAGIRAGYLTPGEAKAVYTAYGDGMKRVIISDGLTDRGAETMSDASINVQASVLKTFADPAALALSADDNWLYRAVINVRRGLTTEEKTGSAYSNMAAVNRAAAKMFANFAKVEDFVAAVTEDTVRGWISKVVAEPKGDLDKLKVFVDTGMKLSKGDFSLEAEFVDLISKLQTLQAKIVANRAAVAKQETVKGNVTTH
jgi:hypothetical protein